MKMEKKTHVLNLIKECIPDLIDIIHLTTYTAMAIGGELMQKAVSFGNREYNWGVGHISNIGASGMFTIGLLSIAGNLNLAKKMEHKLTITFGVPTLFSAMELIPLFSEISSKVYDPQDIVCYYGAAIAAFGLKEVCDRLFNKNNSLEKTLITLQGKELVDYFSNKKSLSSIIAEQNSKQRQMDSFEQYLEFSY